MFKKKILGVFALIVTICLSNNNVYAMEIQDNKDYVNHNGINITEKQMQNLINLGFTSEQIEYMQQEEFDNNKDLIGTVVSQKNIYQKTTYVPINSKFHTNSVTSSNDDLNNYIIYSEEITEEEYNNAPIEDSIVSPNGLITDNQTTEYKKLSSTIIAVNGRYRLKGDLQWRKMPKVRKGDLLTLVNNSVTSSVPKTFYAYQVAKRDNPCDRLTEDVSSSPKTTRQTSDGYAVSFDLPKDSTCEHMVDGVLGPQWKTETKAVTTINSYAYYEVTNLTNVYAVDVWADYAHGTGSISIDPTATLSLSNSGIGVEISFSGSYKDKFDSMNTAHAQLSGINWTK